MFCSNCFFTSVCSLRLNLKHLFFLGNWKDHVATRISKQVQIQMYMSLVLYFRHIENCAPIPLMCIYKIFIGNTHLTIMWTWEFLWYMICVRQPFGVPFTIIWCRLLRTVHVIFSQKNKRLAKVDIINIWKHLFTLTFFLCFFAKTVHHYFACKNYCRRRFCPEVTFLLCSRKWFCMIALYQK